jgi:hydroxymethylpyrimidine/phosphomethylpyrimidine kinase
VLSIAAADPSAGAGIQADLKAIEASGGYAVTALTGVTVQNTQGVTGWQPLSADLIGRQLRALFEDLAVSAIKTGVLGSAAIVCAVAEVLRGERRRPCVVDPVVRASGGFRFHDDAAVQALSQEMAPIAALLTPNVEDVRALTGLDVTDEPGAVAAGRRLLELGWGAVLVKGGHFGDARATDVLVERSGTRTFTAERVPGPNAHGTGCVLSAAIATGLARGLELGAAVERAKLLVTESLRQALPLGRGRGPIDPLHALHASDAVETRSGRGS